VPLHDRFKALVDAQYDAIWSYTAFLAGSAPDTEDLVQETFLAAFDHMAAGRSFTKGPDRWLRAVARNRVCTWWRTKRKLPAASAETLKALADEADVPASLAIKAELESALKRCLEILRADDRALIQKRYCGGFEPARLAEEMRMNAATLRVRLFRLRQWLKRCVEKRLPAVHGT